jgi:hypothetical protein
MLNDMPRPLYPRKRDSAPLVEDAGWASGPVSKGGENLAPTGTRSPNLMQASGP